MAKSDTLLLLDFDGTLFFTDNSVAMASKELLGKRLRKDEIRKLPRKTKSMIYELGFSKYRDLSTPNTRLIKLIKRKTVGANCAILTARLDGSQKDIRYLLKRDGVPALRLICRGRSERHMRDEEWKTRMVSSLAKKHKSIELFEDKLDNIRCIRSGIDSDNVDFFLVRRNSVKKV